MPLSLLPIKGTRNLRDMGGLTTSSGQWLRQGLLFRSGSLHELDAQSMTALADLGLRTICDFRAPDERRDQPTPFINDMINVLEWDEAQEAIHRGIAECGEETYETGRRTMMLVYEQLPLLHRGKYRAMFDKIVDGAVPLLFHCAAGKDRTGVAAALILAALNVSREDILADYAASERLVDYASLFRRDALMLPNSWIASFLEKPAPFLSAVFSSPADYLAHALDTIAERCGSIDAYLEREMGLDATRMAILHERLLD